MSRSKSIRLLQMYRIVLHILPLIIMLHPNVLWRTLWEWKLIATSSVPLLSYATSLWFLSRIYLSSVGLTTKWMLSISTSISFCSGKWGEGIVEYAWGGWKLSSSSSNLCSICEGGLSSTAWLVAEILVGSDWIKVQEARCSKRAGLLRRMLQTLWDNQLYAKFLKCDFWF